MPICRRSAISRALFAFACTGASAQAEPPPALPAAAANAPDANAANAIARAAAPASVGIAQAIARQTPASNSGTQPRLPATLPQSDIVRARAFDAMRRQTGDRIMGDRARDAKALGDAGLAREADRVSAQLGAALGLKAPDIVAVAKVAAPDAKLRWVPLLFVSSSMPLDELRSYAVQLEQTGGALAFRGMPGGLHRAGPMAKLAADILKADPGCEGPACVMHAVQIVIDPIAFRQYAIARVPALTMVPGDPTQPYCERTPDQPAGAVAYGDAALSGLLDDLSSMGDKEEVRDAQSRLEKR